ncbi:glycosyltransferase family 4 protein, partial [candidate division KSB1 bacterium]|nr:glycosyltransferase family 4 protein [candidate division KSB1 bacterium]
MKIAFINQPFDDFEPPVQNGSVAIWIYQVVQQLKSDQNFNIVVYARKNGPHKTLTIDEIEYRYISPTFDKWLLRILRRVKFTRYLPLFASIFYCIGYIFQIALNIKSQKCDIVHLHNYSQFIPILRLLNPKIKIIVHMHGEWLTQLNANLIKSRISQANLIIGCSNYITSLIKSRFPELVDRCKTIYNGVNIDQFKPGLNVKLNRKTKQILFVGRHSPEKGVHLLIEAAKHLIQIFPDFHIHIIGPKVLVAREFIVNLSDNTKVQYLAEFYKSEDNYFTYI